MNLYDILELKKDCSDEEIKVSYRKLAKKYHPDICKEKNAEDIFKKISKAYEVLIDPEKRKRYDNGEDIDRSFSIEQEAVNGLVSMFSRFVQERGLDSGESVIDWIEYHIDKGVVELTEKSKQSKQKIKSLKKNIDRFKTSEETNIFKSTLEQMIANEKNNRKILSKNFLISRYANRLIEKYTEENIADRFLYIGDGRFYNASKCSFNNFDVGVNHGNKI